MKFKKIISCLLMVAMIGTTSSAFADSSTNVQNNRNWTNVEDITVKGEKVATRETTYIYERKVNKDDVTVEVSTKDHYDFLESAPSDLKNELQDKTETVTFKRNNKNEYFIDGEKLDKETLSQPLVVPAPESLSTSTPNSFAIAASSDTGGVPQISHYYGNYTTYSFDTYSKLTATFGPGGNHASATGNINNTYVNRAMNTIDRFSDHYASFRDNLSLFSASLGGVVLTWETLIGGIVSGVGAVSAAILARGYYNDCNSDLNDIYNYVTRI